MYIGPISNMMINEVTSNNDDGYDPIKRVYIASNNVNIMCKSVLKKSSAHLMLMCKLVTEEFTTTN